VAKPRPRHTPPQRLILDSGAVIALSRRDVRARAVLAAAHEVGALVSIPSVVVAETVRGNARDAPVNRLIAAIGDVVVADEAVGRVAGGLLGRVASTSTVDAIVVATAACIGGAAIVTGDADDLRLLASGRPEVVIQSL
jgi:predicted nucleic acid-binding protein